MANLIPWLQARARQVQGTRGGPLIGGSDFVQLVAPVATADGPFRNPALEAGEGLHRTFQAGTGFVGPTALQRTTFQLFTEDDNTLLHCRRIIINLAGSTTAVRFGFAASPGALTDFQASWRDGRIFELANTNVEGAQIRYRGGTTVTDLFSSTAYIYVQAGTFSTSYIDVDFVMTRFDAGKNTSPILTVQAETVNTQMAVAFEGEVYTFGPGAR